MKNLGDKKHLLKPERKKQKIKLTNHRDKRALGKIISNNTSQIINPRNINPRENQIFHIFHVNVNLPNKGTHHYKNKMK
jgi:phage gp46-like protein